MPSQTVDVSIIISTFNRLWCLPKAICSARNTTCETQIIVVDDGSTDGTWEWLQEQRDVTAVYQFNQGQTWAINAGVNLATGKYIRFLDSDDFLCEGTIDRQYIAAVRSGADIVYSRVDALKLSSGLIIRSDDLPLWDDFLSVHLAEPVTHLLGMLFKRSLVEKVPRRPDFALVEDLMFLLEVALLSPSITLVEGLAGYRLLHTMRYKGLTAIAAAWQTVTMYKRIFAELEHRGELTLRRKRAASRILWPLAQWIARSCPLEAAEVADWIYELLPDFVPPQRGALGWLYRNVGFRTTERILRARRGVRRIFVHQHVKIRAL